MSNSLASLYRLVINQEVKFVFAVFRATARDKQQQVKTKCNVGLEKVKWTDKKRNQEILGMMEEKRDVLATF